jgi:hypothetical protein
VEEGTAIFTSTESWNGTNWSAVDNLNTATNVLAAAGTSTSAIAFGGSGDPGLQAGTEEWYGDGKVTENFTTS